MIATVIVAAAITLGCRIWVQVWAQFAATSFSGIRFFLAFFLKSFSEFFFGSDQEELA